MTDIALIKIEDQARLKRIYEDLEQPGVQKAGKAIGNILSLTRMVTTIFEYPTIRLKSSLQTYKDKLEKIEYEKIIPVRPEISVPILQALQYTESEELSTLFVNLLTNASHIDYSASAHPSFIEVIKNLTPDEAQIISQMQGRYIPFIELHIHNIKDDGKKESHFINHCELDNFNVSMTCPNNKISYYENIQKLGLITRRTDIRLQKNEIYEAIEQSHEQKINEIVEALGNVKKSIGKGVYEITDYGKKFRRICIE